MFRNPSTRLASIAVAVPAFIAAVVSFEHLREVAEFAGEEWRSWLLPLSVDGLVVAASIAALVARREGRKVPPMTVVNLLVGLGVSVMANVLVPFLDVLTPQARDILSAAVAAWPAIALALAFEELLRLRGSASTSPEVPQVLEVPAQAEPAAEAEPVPEPKLSPTVVTAPVIPTEVIPAPGDDVREAAIEAVRRNPDLTGRELGEMFPRGGVPRSDSWGRQIKRAAANVTQLA